MYCDDCGAQIPADAKFCRKCGTPLPALEGAATPSAYVFPVAEAVPGKRNEAAVAIGRGVWILSGIVGYGFQILCFYAWWDLPGLLAALVLAPAVILLPVIFLIQEGFSWLFLVLVIIDLVAIVGFMLSREADGED